MYQQSHTLNGSRYAGKQCTATVGLSLQCLGTGTVVELAPDIQNH
ncbi:MAG: hypothetical protein OJF55_001311 [Rhodanobacteraceae bacterium]|nr:MAG: hypothetical protein OJF55_001311 [Rhodanobacteraceae bacterium]